MNIIRIYKIFIARIRNRDIQNKEYLKKLEKENAEIEAADVMEEDDGDLNWEDVGDDEMDIGQFGKNLYVHLNKILDSYRFMARYKFKAIILKFEILLIKLIIDFLSTNYEQHNFDNI